VPVALYVNVHVSCNVHVVSASGLVINVHVSCNVHVVSASGLVCKCTCIL